jgi:hypothetical protein
VLLEKCNWKGQVKDDGMDKVCGTNWRVEEVISGERDENRRAGRQRRQRVDNVKTDLGEIT